MLKCPVCGYQYGQQYNYSKEVFELSNKRTERTKKYLKRLSEDVMLNIPSEFTLRAYYFFLKGVETVDDRTIVRAIEQYLRAGHHLQGKGFAYLKAMINNESANRKKKLSNEYKRLGRTPKIRRLKNE